MSRGVSEGIKPMRPECSEVRIQTPNARGKKWDRMDAQLRIGLIRAFILGANSGGRFIFTRVSEWISTSNISSIKKPLRSNSTAAFLYR